MGSKTQIDRSRLKRGKKYKHFKGQIYEVLMTAEDAETGKTLVIYQAQYEGYKIYAREIEMFLSPVDKEKYPEVTQKYRFEEV